MKRPHYDHFRKEFQVDQHYTGPHASVALRVKTRVLCRVALQHPRAENTVFSLALELVFFFMCAISTVRVGDITHFAQGFFLSALKFIGVVMR